jgi:SET domain/MYND finger
VSLAQTLSSSLCTHVHVELKETMTDNDRSEQESSPQLCSYCERPPTAGTTLKRCSRCHKAWYHGAECQRNHFRVHKKECRASSLSHPVTTTTKPKCLLFSIDERAGRGKCLVAGATLRRGERVASIDNTTREGGWYPLVPPVLHKEYRMTRCAFCFHKLAVSSICRCDSIPLNPLYTLLFCSTQCRDGAIRNGMDHEERAVSLLCQGKAPSQMLSTAILLYRILLHRKDPIIHNQIERLQCHPRREETECPEDGTVEDEASEHHARGVIATVMGMLLCSNESVYNRPLPSTEQMKELIFSIKINSFSIVINIDADDVTYGFGLFAIPSFINHSCHANAVQTFALKRGVLPTLFLTAFRDIQPGEEITISYTDTSCPRHLRQHRLAEGYFFHCCCEACQDVHIDASLMGMKCQECTSSTVVQVEERINPSRGNRLYRCSNCGRTDFDTTLEMLKPLEHDPPSSEEKKSLADVRDTHRRVAKVCHVDSWYAYEAAERLFEASLACLEDEMNNPVRLNRAAGEALRLGEELLIKNCPLSTRFGATAVNDAGANPSTFMKRQILRYKVAKLRYLTTPDPRECIQELQDVLRSLSPFYPKGHEPIVGLKGFLATMHSPNPYLANHNNA